MAVTPPVTTLRPQHEHGTGGQRRREHHHGGARLRLPAVARLPLREQETQPRCGDTSSAPITSWAGCATKCAPSLYEMLNVITLPSTSNAAEIQSPRRPSTARAAHAGLLDQSDRGADGSTRRGSVSTNTVPGHRDAQGRYETVVQQVGIEGSPG